MLDVAVNNARVFDPWTKSFAIGSVGARAGAITQISTSPLSALEEIDAGGLALCPGFIDAHTHMDGAVGAGDPAHVATLALRQGVTTVVSGNCGFGVTPGSFSALMAGGFPINQAALAGHASLRAQIGLDDIYAAANEEQTARIAELAERALLGGYAGISFGLGYVPGSGEAEVMTLAGLAARHKKVIAIDTKMDTPTDLNGLRHALNIALKTGARLVISHFVYQYGSEVLKMAQEMMKRARQGSAEVWADSGMYTQWATSIGAWMFREEFIFENPDVLDSLLAISGEHMGEQLSLERYRHMRLEHPGDIVACMAGDDGLALLSLSPDFVMPSSDSAPCAPGQGHPQAAGSFAKYLRKVRETGFLPLEEALYRATLLPARVFGLSVKNRMDIGADADLTLFDPDTICDRAAFPPGGAPDAPCIGVKCAIVGGKVCVLNGEERNLSAGRAVYVR